MLITHSFENKFDNHPTSQMKLTIWVTASNSLQYCCKCLLVIFAGYPNSLNLAIENTMILSDDSASFVEQIDFLGSFYFDSTGLVKIYINAILAGTMQCTPPQLNRSCFVRSITKNITFTMVYWRVWDCMIGVWPIRIFQIIRLLVLLAGPLYNFWERCMFVIVFFGILMLFSTFL